MRDVLPATPYAPMIKPGDPHRVTPHVPLVVLPGTLYPVTPWDLTRPSRLAAQHSMPALDQLVDAARNPDRRALPTRIPDAVDALGELAEHLAVWEPPALASAIAPGKHIHRYFGVRHSDVMSSGAAALYAVCVIRWCVAELEFAALEANHVLAELEACRRIVSQMAYAPRHREASDPTPPDPETRALLDYLPAGSPWDRWTVAHHGYLLCNLVAADLIRRAVLQLRHRRSYGTAVDLLEAATVQIRGLTAMMLHSAVLPGRLYRDEIRPTMSPGAFTALPKPLTGNAFTEHHTYRRRLGELLAALEGEPYDTLSRRVCRVADARAGVVAADLRDLEHHIVMGDELLGGRDDEPSLVQADGDSAVAELRRLRAVRVEQLRPFLRAGDLQA